MVDSKAIREALAKATPGPWEAWGSNGILHVTKDDRTHECIADIVVRRDDAHLIANAPTWLQQLLDENDRLKEENQKTRETLKGCEYCHKKALEDFKALQNIMDRARALAMQSEEEWQPRYRMDANGNLTRVEQIDKEKPRN